MKRFSNKSCLLAVLLASALPFVSVAGDVVTPAQADALFAKANDAYSRGEYAEARALYERIAASGNYSPDLFYNLGNAFAKLGQSGHALLNYQRSLALDPHHPEAAHNAEFLRSQLPEIPATPGFLQRFFGHFSANDFALLLSAALWTLAACAAIGLFTRWSPPMVAVATLAILTAGLAALGFLTMRTLDPDAASAMCTAPDARAHFAPAASSQTVAPVPPGTPLRILATDRDWCYVRLPDNRLGWMLADSLARILPEPETPPKGDNTEHSEGGAS